MGGRRLKRDWKCVKLFELFAKWVPRLLTFHQQLYCMTSCNDILQLVQKNPPTFPHTLVFVDKICIHLFTPENEDLSKQWVVSGETAPRWWKSFLQPEILKQKLFGIVKEYCPTNIRKRSNYYFALSASFLELLKTKLHKNTHY